MSNLTGKWALVTGASRGVGKQFYLMSRGLTEDEASAMIVNGFIEPLVKELRERGVEARAVAAELSDAAQVDALIDGVLRDTGGVDILYNNAAIMTPWREAHTSPAQDYRQSFEVNVIALTRLCDRLLPAMLERRWGRIVNVTSGIENIRELLPYSMSKAAVDRYVRDVSPSLEGTGVIMSLLDPGWLRTDLGGDKAPNAVETCLPGALVPVLLEEGAPSGRFYRAQDYRTDSAQG